MTERINKMTDTRKIIRHNMLMNSKAKEAVNRMMDCLLSEQSSDCKRCSDVNSCVFLTEALFTYNCKMGKHSTTRI
jgi:hypothetical protein